MKMEKDGVMEFGNPGMVGHGQAHEHDSQKLGSYINPKEDTETLELANLIDMQTLQSLVDDFHALVQVPMAIIDLKGRVLVGAGWQQICLNFHRIHPVTCANCLESDLLLSSGVPMGEFRLYKCKNNMWDIATPIVIDRRHVGNLFSGQFFFDDELPDYELFRAQARQYGFDENAYIAAVNLAPRLSREVVNRAMTFFVRLAHMISHLGYSNLQLAYSLTERDQLMGSLRESEQRWQTTLMSVGDGVVATDETGKVTFLNPLAERLTGWSSAEAAGQPLATVLNIIHEQTGQPANNPVEKVLQSGQVVGLANHTALIARNGQVTPIEDSAAPILDAAGKITGVVMVFHDVTVQRKAEAELRKNNETLRQLSRAVEQSPVSVVITDIRGKIEYVNPKFTQLTGYSLAEAQGQNPRILKSGQTPVEAYHQMWTTIRAGGQWQGEFCNRKKNGDLYWESASISPITDEHGVISHFVAVKEDITERKKAEATLAESAQKLARSNRDLEQFAFVASHDLQEPLRKIRMFGDRLRDQLRGSCSEEAQDYLNRMHSASERMQTMIDGLLELSRVNTRGGTFAAVQLTKVAHEALSDLEARVKTTRGEVTIADLPTIEADELQIRRLFQNLIGNALKFHKPDVPPIISITGAIPHNGGITIQIKDNGIGFDEQYSEQIFQPFQRLHGRSEYEGTGLGLSICRKIVERHHGQIEVHSQPGVGTTFILHLPLKQSF